MSDRRTIEAAFGRRVYEYVDDEGTRYYSFTLKTKRISAPTRLILQSRLGTHILNFLSSLRHKAERLQKEQDG